MSDIFKGKKILVTGGTGSFGHYIVKALFSYKPEEIRIFSRDEEKQDHMRYEFRNLDNLNFIIGDVRNADTLRNAVGDIDIVFHAAALKQVPSCEYNVYEAVRTNILGAYNVINVAIEEEVEKVIAISTDKAVKPVNAMGMTKALQERLFISANLHKANKKTVFSCVRYGNVVGSRGSVIPLFKKQIKDGMSVTITDFKMTRFILTLSEAINLVFKAAELSIGGEIFVLKVPSIRIIDLAEVLIESLADRKDTKIETIGIRPGEKINEILISEEETSRTVDNGDFFIILPYITIPWTIEKYKDKPRIKIGEFSSFDAKKHTEKEIKKMLLDEGWI